MIDVSDGLRSEARHIAEASEVSVDVHTAALTIPDELNAVASATGADALAFVLGGGEDHSLLAAFPPDVELPDGWTVIGTIGEPGGEAVTVDGEVYEGPAGWTHF
jgi:thiamine-monophosphate kinase